MQSVAILLCGYAVFGSLQLGVTHLRRHNYGQYPFACSMGHVMLAVLVGLQLCHVAYFLEGSLLVFSPLYQVLLFAVAPTFYLFSSPILMADAQLQWRQLLHVLPVLIAPILSFEWALPLAFVIGTGYLGWLVKGVYALRRQRDDFQIELSVLLLILGVGVVAVISGLSVPWLPHAVFFQAYAIAIGLIVLLINMLIGWKPALSQDVVEIAQTTYAHSTLQNVDCDRVLTLLGNLMDQDQVFKDPLFDLTVLARALQLSTHQVSELLNTRLGKSFSRYVREYRVEAAEELLLDRPSMPVLSVGLEVGFNAQSNFYEAFRELTGMTPGQYRKIHQVAASIEGAKLPV